MTATATETDKYQRNGAGEPQGGGRKETAGAAAHSARAGAQGRRHPDEHGSRHESARRRGEREAPKKKGGGHTTSKPAPAAARREKESARKGRKDNKRPKAAPERARETTQKNENATRGAGKAGDETEEGGRRDARTHPDRPAADRRHKRWEADGGDRRRTPKAATAAAPTGRRHRIEKEGRPNESRAAPLFQHNLASDASRRRKPDKIMLNRGVRRTPAAAGKRHKKERSHRRKRPPKTRETATSTRRRERDSRIAGLRSERSERSRRQRRHKHTRRTAATDGGRPKGGRRRSADGRRDRLKGRDEDRNEGGRHRGGERAEAAKNEGKPSNLENPHCIGTGGSSYPTQYQTYYVGNCLEDYDPPRVAYLDTCFYCLLGVVDNLFDLFFGNFDFHIA